MRVLVTGGTGFVGSHTVRALLDDGHEVRLLVRDPSRVLPALEPLGLTSADVDVVTASITDADAVRRAVDGCGGVVHAAAVYSWDPRRATEMERTNAAAALVVLGEAARAGANPIVHVSSTVALARKSGGSVDRHSPNGDAIGSYPRSKQASDATVRAMRAVGAPIVRVHPCGQIGPHDPYLGATNTVLVQILRGRAPFWPSGSLPWGDVRDTAATIAAVIAGRGGDADAWLSPLHNLRDGAILEALQQVTGRRIRTMVVPGRVLAPSVRATRGVIRLLPAGVPLPLPTEGASDLIAAGTLFDDADTVTQLGVPRRELHASLRDTIAWLAAAGHIRPDEAGRARG